MLYPIYCGRNFFVDEPRSVDVLRLAVKTGKGDHTMVELCLLQTKTT